jgi:hypothetical protein
MSAPLARPTTRLPQVLLVAGLLVLLLEAAVFCLYGTTVYDEGGYLYEGWLAVSEGWLPFRDFHAKLPPLVYYLYGVGQHFFGPSLLVGRIESAVFMFGTLGLGVWMARRLAGPWAATLLVWLLAANPAALNASLHAYAIAPTAFFMVLALALLVLPRPGPAALLGHAAAVGGMLLCRHDLLPFAAALWVWVLWRYPERLSWRLAGVLGSWAVFALAVLPFYLQAPGNVLSALSLGFLGPQVPGWGSYVVGTEASVHTVAWHVMIFLRHYAGPLLMLVPALVGPWARRRERDDLRFFWLMLGAATVNWLSHLPAALVTGGNVFYLLDPYIFFPVAIAAAGLFVMLLREAGGVGSIRRALSAVAVFAIAMPVFTGPGPTFELTRARPTALQQVRTGAEALRRLIPRGSVIFTIDDPHQFLEAELLLPSPLTHQLFTHRESDQTDLLRRMHFFNDEMIRQWLSGEAQYAVISGGAKNWMLNSGRFSGGERLGAFIDGLLDRNYRLLAEVPGTMSGPLRVYQYRGAAPAATRGTP